MEFYLIRHGQSTNNRGDARVSDPHLTELGKEQADKVGKALVALGITRLYCSAMLRTVQTANIISAHTNLEPHVYVGIHEWGGLWEDRGDAGVVQHTGLTRSQLREICPNIVLPDAVTDRGWWFRRIDECESAPRFDDNQMHQLAHDNARAFIAHLDKWHSGDGERVAAVSHGGFGSTLIGTFLGLQPDADHDRFPHHNTAITKICRTPERTQSIFQNRIHHLLVEDDLGLEASSPLIS